MLLTTEPSTSPQKCWPLKPRLPRGNQAHCQRVHLSATRRRSCFFAASAKLCATAAPSTKSGIGTVAVNEGCYTLPTSKASRRPTHKLECRASAQQSPRALASGSGLNPVQVAFVENLRLAETGDAAAMFRVADFYSEGCGVAKSTKLADKWFLWSSTLGCVAAQGCCALRGVGETQNQAKGFKLLQRAAVSEGAMENFYVLGCRYYHGEGTSVDHREAVRCFRTAADQGYASAQQMMGHCFQKGHGVHMDKKMALHWLLKAGDQGFSMAQFNLGVCFFTGEGVSKDTGQAVKWFRLAAEQGYANAQHNIGGILFVGDGVARDYVEAVKWFRLAAEQGDSAAQHGLGNAYYKGAGVTHNFTEAVKWYQLAAARGNSSAQGNLGICFVKGHGVVKDIAKGVEWLRKAAAHGPADEGGAGAIDALKQLGLPLQWLFVSLFGWLRGAFFFFWSYSILQKRLFLYIR